MADTERFERLDLSKVQPSKTNPRKTFDPAKLDELAASITEKGVIQPVLVRPIKLSTKGVELFGQFELVAGERRYRASKLAKVETIPAVIRDLTDKQVLEIQVIENDQREDVPPLEQAEGYHQLIAAGYDVPAIAAKIGRSEGYVHARLVLLQLIPALQKDLRSGKLPFSHANLLARTVPAVQKELSGRLFDWQGNIESLQFLKRRVREVAVRDLSAAPWKKDDAELLPKVGSCKDCTKRSGSRPGLFDELLNGDLKTGRDFCTDPGCYADKQTAFVQLQIRKLADAGEKPVKLSDDYGCKDKSAMRRYDVREVTAKEAKACKPGEVKMAVIIDGHEAGKVVKYIERPNSSHSSGGSDNRARKDEAARRRKAEAGKAAAIKANGVVAAKAQGVFGELQNPSPKFIKALRSIVETFAGHSWADECRVVCKRRGLDTKDVRESVVAVATKSNSGAELFALLAEVVAARRSFGWGSPYASAIIDRDEAQFWDVWGVDAKKLIRDAAKEKATKPAKSKAKAGKKAKASA